MKILNLYRELKIYDVLALQLESLQGEAEKLQDTKPEEAQIIREKIAEINNVWMDLKDMVSCLVMFFLEIIMH